MTKFIVVAGGVISGVGKGVTTAGLGKVLREYGYSVTLIKIDPYINVDAGTLRPTEHGEVWVTQDGGEIDQDLGTYERFLGKPIPKKNSITTGQIYQSVIQKERAGHYLGKTVQFVPHIIDEIKERIKHAAHGYDIAIVEIGGIVGDYENVPYLFAFKALEREIGAHNVAHVLVTYLPVPEHIGEMKTKPTQQAIRLMGQEGLLPNFIICRSEKPLDAIRKKKIEEVANVPSENVISAPNVSNIYQIPLDLVREGLGNKLLQHLHLEPRKKPVCARWKQLISQLQQATKSVTIGIIGKYVESGDFALTDSYVSVYHALVHAAAHCSLQVSIRWLDAKQFERDAQTACQELNELDGVVIPGGFGASGVEGKITAIEYIRTHGIPYLGLCYGMQLAVIEYMRSVCGKKHAHTTEVAPDSQEPAVAVLPLQQALLDKKELGGTMRLGSYAAQLHKGTRVYDLYAQMGWINADDTVYERHRHRYEVMPAAASVVQQAGGCFSGCHNREDGTRLVEFFEVPNHPFFVATQAHPEFNSWFERPHPLFVGLISAAEKQSAKH